MTTAQTGYFKYDHNNDGEFLLRLNSALIGLESQLFKKDLAEDHPNLFILGLPRSGTTLLSQILFNNFNLSCTNNLMARFWEAPLTGTHLSKIIIGNAKDVSYRSDYARTEHISAPHEFSYFWRRMLLISDSGNFDPTESAKRIDWPLLKNIIVNMNHIMGGGMVFKTLEYSGFFLEEFSKVFEKSCFIYIKRNPLDTAISIAKARMTFNTDLNDWWGSYPLEYNKIKNEPFETQIAAQMFYLKSMFEKNIQKASYKVIEVNYEDVCKTPQLFFDALIAKIKSLYGIELEQITKMEPLKLSSPEIDEEIKVKLKAALKKFDLM